MVRITRFDDEGDQQAEITLDDFTIEILYSGIADLLQRASTTPDEVAPAAPMSGEARRRRSRILTRLLD
jgi:hypothetical protein